MLSVFNIRLGSSYEFRKGLILNHRQTFVRESASTNLWITLCLAGAYDINWMQQAMKECASNKESAVAEQNVRMRTMSRAKPKVLNQKVDVKARQHFPKNNFFCYRWRVIDNFDKSIDREMYHQQLTGGRQHQSLLNERILALYKMSYRRRKNDFISKLTQDAMSFLEGRRKALSLAVQEDRSYTKSMVDIVDTFFNILLSCSIELNTVLGFSELFISTTEPELQTYMVGGQLRVRSVHARFSTSQFSIVLFGQRNVINFYVVPVDSLIGSQHPGSGREPMISCVAQMINDQVQWFIDDIPINEDVVEAACHSCLREMMESTQSVVSRMALVG